MSAKTVFMFSGQGSQYFHMGADFSRSNAGFRHHLSSLDRTVRANTGVSILETLYSPEYGKSEPFSDTRLSSLAIFMVELAMSRVLIERGFRPDIMLTVSMGAYAAMNCSGMVSTEAMMDTISAVSLSMTECCPAGSMLAVLASPSLHERSPVLMRHSEIASITSDSQFVLSAPDSALPELGESLQGSKVPYQRMPVSRAYHSRWIDPVADSFMSAFQALPVKAGSIPLQTCSGEESLSMLSAEKIWSIVRNAIRFREAVQRLEADGPSIYIDVGPSGTLATLLKYVLPSESRSRIYSILTPFDRSELNFQVLCNEQGL